MEEFLKILSPSMRIRVTNCIFSKAILQNPIFDGKLDVVDFIVNYIKPKLSFPEDPIIRMGQAGDCIYFLAGGECLLSITNHLKQIQVYKEEITQGSYFGEVALILGSVRSANIESKNYCTLAQLNKEHFEKLC